MRSRTMKQQAVYHFMLRYGQPVRRVEVTKDVAITLVPELPESLPEYLPWTEGSARDVLEALVRRGEAIRHPGSPARYEAIPYEQIPKAA